jgi:hypothetical protein
VRIWMYACLALLLNWYCCCCFDCCFVPPSSLGCFLLSAAVCSSLLRVMMLFYKCCVPARGSRKRGQGSKCSNRNKMRQGNKMGGRKRVWGPGACNPEAYVATGQGVAALGEGNWLCLGW